MNLLNKIKEFMEERKFQNFLKRNEWYGLIPGDIIEYKGRKLMYRGIDVYGGPGMIGIPEPYFGPASPNDSYYIFYLRQIDEWFSKEVFGEDNQSIQAGGGTITKVFGEGELSVITPHKGESIKFLNATRSDLKKVGHITPKEWEELLKI